MSEIILSGIRQQVLGGYNCLRGYAPMNDLIEVSEARNYQRKIIDKHIEEISDFYRSDKYLFFPEIILACEIDDSEFFRGMQLEYGATLSSKGIKYRYYKSNGKSELKINTEQIKLHIIDGNHRLKAFVETPFEETKLVPFCILFLSKGINDKDAQVIFNNINYKHKPLRLEENLERIFSEEGQSSFEDNEIKETFGLEFLEAKKLLIKIENSDIADHFKRLFPDYRTACYKIMDFIKCEEKLTDDFCEENDVVKIIKDFIFENLKSISIDLGLFIALLYMKLFDQDNYMYFLNWVKKYKIIELTNLNPADIINISNSIKQQTSRQIFVSMPFGEDECDDMYDAIVEVAASISADTGFKIPKPIRIDSLEKSHTYLITDEILSHIENAGYIIADLTYQRQNVYHEIGYAMGYIKGKGLSENLLLVMKNPPAGQEHDEKYNVGFNLRAYNQLRYTKLSTFKKDIKEKLLLHYGLK